MGAFLVAEPVRNPPAMQETLLDSWVWMMSWRRDSLPTPGFLGFPDGSDGKESTCNEEDLGSAPGSGRSPGGGHDTHSSVLAWRLRVDRGAWRATVHGVAESSETEQLSFAPQDL